MSDFKASVENFINDVNTLIIEKNVDLPYKTKVVAKFNKKYVKLITTRSFDGIKWVEESVYAFIVSNENDNQFLLGDFLKSASWNAPARNCARGNILNGTASYDQYGASYLN